jgi:hypothetical protein
MTQIAGLGAIGLEDLAEVTEGDLLGQEVGMTRIEAKRFTRNLNHHLPATQNPEHTLRLESIARPETSLSEEIVFSWR